MSKHNVWDRVSRKEKQKVVSLKWIFTIKNNNTYKARLVSGGCKGPEIYSPENRALPTSLSLTICRLL